MWPLMLTVPGLRAGAGQRVWEVWWGIIVVFGMHKQGSHGEFA